MARPAGILPSGCAGGLRGFSTAHPCAGEKLARIHASHPAGFSSPTRRAIGAPGRAARSQRALFRRARSRAKPDQEQSSEAMLRSCRCSSALHRVRATMVRCSTRGPLRGGESGSTGPEGGIGRDADAFSPGQESGRKARPRLTDLPGTMPGKRQAGGSFSLGYFSFGQAKEK